MHLLEAYSPENLEEAVEVVANAIHRGVEPPGPFIAVNCGALPDNLVESELFGHKKGAFSGASENRVGLVRAAHGARQVWLAEPHPARRAAVAAAGDFRVFDPATEPGPGEDAAHLVIDGVGFEATRAAACRAARRGGAIVHIGLGHAASGLDVRRLTLAEIAFLGVYTYTEADFRDTAAALFAGRLGALDWVETRPLAEGARAFADLQAGRVSAPKIVLCP
ncbi:MAG: sigma 54-interacting transcriptional regulator [Pseudomonadota bacterium]